MNTVILYPDSLVIPDSVTDLASFRRWYHSGEFPETGRICYLDGGVWVDMSPEQVFTHNQVKYEFGVALVRFVRQSRLGRYYPDGVRLTNEDAGLSNQPDGTFILSTSLRARRVRVVAGARRGFVELTGTPDMVLEVVSDSSVTKDTEILPDLYWRAGIPEYWLADVRRETLRFDIFRYGPRGYVATRKQRGWVPSQVFGKSFRLTRTTDADGQPEYILEVR